MRIGIVCPYSFDVPGGVQFHIRDLAGALIARGHDVSVLAPADSDTPVPSYVVTTGRSVPVHYNGSVARLAFGPLAATRTRRWLAEGEFNVLHIHEPMPPSLGLLALWIADGPIVATFHSAQTHSRAMSVARPFMRSPLEKIRGAIAVSEDARRTLVDHVGGDAVIIPNGVHVRTFADAEPRDAWRGTPDRPTVAFLGRLDEPRKGLDVLLRALPDIRAAVPGLRVLVAGRGEVGTKALGACAESVEILGPVSEEDKSSLLASVDLYVAPHTGGESFGIVLVEAMSAGAGVVASDLGAFRRVLDDGALGTLFATGDCAALARAVIGRVRDKPGTRDVARAAAEAVSRYDWSAVTSRILAVYETVAVGHVEEDRTTRGRWWGR
ncbi:MAG: glycosyltransferase family 4 protein [Bifidobacteriaceae bacterium]|jgi:phosphatidylinositol alpha-mannosyltransferase|nr:glycosyltransferase family 4 protein [Bifidobacteriaceae bacterium]